MKIVSDTYIDEIGIIPLVKELLELEGQAVTVTYVNPDEAEREAYPKVISSGNLILYQNFIRIRKEKIPITEILDIYLYNT